MADLSVWPMLVKALVCLEAAVDEEDAPPLYRSIRTGTDIQASISPTQDECCQGLAWVRPVQVSPTSSFPTPVSEWQNCPPGELAVELELGVLRCAPTMGPGSEADFPMVTPEQWAITTSRVLADGASMRRAACCLIEQGFAVLVGSWTPLPVEANCTGSTLRITVAVSFCERTC